MAQSNFEENSEIEELHIENIRFFKIKKVVDLTLPNGWSRCWT